VVDDNGQVSAGKIGSGLSAGHAVESSFHVVDVTNSPSRGVIVGQHDGSAAAANVIFRKSRGTDLSPSAVAQGDYIAAFHGNVWDGSKYVTTATVNFQMDGPVTTTSAPQALLLSTGLNSNGAADPGNKIERLRVTSSGDVIIANKGKYSTAATMPVDATAGFMYVPTVGSQHAGHAPLWVDTTNSQLCTCVGATLKCGTLN